MPSKGSSHFSYLTSNLKKSIKTPLAPLTFICGPNRAYKTAILQSLRLATQHALTVSTKKTPITASSKLIKFASDPIQGIQIDLQSSSGFVTFDLPVVEGKPKEIVPRRATGALSNLTEESWARLFPMDAVRSMLSLDARKAREAVIREFAADVTVTSPLGLSDVQKRMWNAALVEAGESDPVSALASISAWARSQKPTKTRQANQKEAALSPAKTQAQISGAERLPALREQLVKAEAWEKSASGHAMYDQTRTRIASLETQESILGAEKDSTLTSLCVMQIQAKANYDKCKQGLDTARETLKGFPEKIAYLSLMIASLDHRLKIKKEICPTCSGDFGVSSMTLRLEVLLGQLKKLQEQSFEREQNVLDMEEHEHLARIELERVNKAPDFTTEHKFLETRAALNEQRRILASLESSLKSIPQTYTGLPSAELRQTIQSLSLVESARNQYETGIVEVRRLHEESAACKVIEMEAQEVMKRVLFQSKTLAEDRVNAFMPRGFRAELHLSPDECEWRAIGADGDFHDASSSGSEYGTLIIALAAAIWPDAPMKILDLDDQDLHAFDPDNIMNLWVSIKHAVDSGAFTQAIVVWNRPEEAPSNKDGWMILNMVPTNGAVRHNRPIAPVSLAEVDDLDMITSI